jgi:hypothetical protein
VRGQSFSVTKPQVFSLNPAERLMKTHMKTKYIFRLLCFILGVLVFAPNLSAQQAQKQQAQKQPPAQTQRKQPTAQNQTTSETAIPKTLVINGQAAPNAVLQLNGRAYADILAFAQLTGATINVLPDRIILTMPGANAAAASSAPQPNPEHANRLSRDFASSAIAYLTAIRQWRDAVETLVGIGAPESRQVTVWLQQHRNRAEESLRLAGVAASTLADQKALQLLQAEFSFMQQWDANAADARQNLDASYSVDPNSIQNDPLLAKISNCDNSLSDMISSGTFSDSGVCR